VLKGTAYSETEQDTTQNIDIITIYTCHLTIFQYDEYWNKTEGRQFLMQVQWSVYNSGTVSARNGGLGLGLLGGRR